MKILILSNGKGEDSIAVTVLRAVQKTASSSSPITLTALPLVGDGHGYRAIGVEVVGARPLLPSGGFGHQGFRNLVEDIRAGLFGLIGHQLATIRNENPDSILAVGDMFPVILGLLSKKPVIHIGTAFSLYLRKTFFFEDWLFRRCEKVFTRDAVTADYYQKKGIRAEYVGNVMMDDPTINADGGTRSVLPCSDTGCRNLDSCACGNDTLSQDKKDPHIVIGLIPSSRMDAYDNLERLFEICRHIPQRSLISFSVSIAPNLEMERIQSIASRFASELRIILETEPLISVIRKSTVAMGMTGTGNEQVVGLGCPLVLIQGRGPQSTKNRLIHYQRLLGESVSVPGGTDAVIGKQVGELLEQPERLTQMGVIGRERMGLPGGAIKIARGILQKDDFY